MDLCLKFLGCGTEHSLLFRSKSVSRRRSTCCIGCWYGRWIQSVAFDKDVCTCWWQCNQCHCNSLQKKVVLVDVFKGKKSRPRPERVATRSLLRMFGKSLWKCLMLLRWPLQKHMVQEQHTNVMYLVTLFKQRKYRIWSESLFCAVQGEVLQRRQICMHIAYIQIAHMEAMLCNDKCYCQGNTFSRLMQYAINRAKHAAWVLAICRMPGIPEILEWSWDTDQFVYKLCSESAHSKALVLSHM